MADNRFAFTTDDPSVAAQILAIMSGGAVNTKPPGKGKNTDTPPATPVQTAPPPGVPDAAPPVQQQPIAPTPSAPVHTPPPPAPAAAPAQVAPPPPAAPQQSLPGWDFDRDIKPRLQNFVGKYSGAELSAWLTEHFGVKAGVQVLAAEWPRLVQALDHAISS